VLAISSLLTIVQALLVLFYIPQLAEETIWFVVAPAICLLRLALVLGFVLGFYRLRRKPARQTSAANQLLSANQITRCHAPVASRYYWHGVSFQ